MPIARITDANVGASSVTAARRLQFTGGADVASRMLRVAGCLVVIALALCVPRGGAAEAQLDRAIVFRALDPIPIPVGADAGPQAFTLADVNKDGRLDVIAVEHDNGRVAVLLGRGDGSFDAAREFDIDGTPTAVAVADLSSPFASDSSGDADGNVDIVVGDEDGFAFVLLGRGDGNFDPPEQELDEVLDTSEIIGLAIADFDGNGRPDVAFLDAFDEVYFLCDDRGNLAPCQTDVLDTGGTGAAAIASGNFDPDHIIDLAVVSRDSGDYSVFYGGGDSSFADPETFPARAVDTNVPSALAVGDLTGDGLDDLVIASNENFDNLTFLVAAPRQRHTFQRRAYSGPFSATVAIALADVDRDGAIDAVFAYDGPDRPDYPVLIPGLAGGMFSQGFLVPGARFGPGRAVALGDLGGDAGIDIVQLAADGQQIQVAINMTVPPCAGDCNANHEVSIDELVLGVAVALGNEPVDRCLLLDRDGSRMVEINELVAAVAHALNGCAAAG